MCWMTHWPRLPNPRTHQIRSGAHEVDPFGRKGEVSEPRPGSPWPPLPPAPLGESPVVSSRDTDLDPPRGNFRILLLADEVNLSGANICMSCKLAHFVHRGTVSNGIVNRSLPETVNPDPPTPQPLGIDARREAVFLHEPPGGLAVEVPPHEAAAVRRHGPEQRPLLVLADAGSRHVGKDRPRGIKQDLSPLLVPLLGDVEIVLDAIGLKMPYAGAHHRRDPAARDEEDGHEREIAN